MDLFRRKSVRPQAEAAADQSLKRALGAAEPRRARYRRHHRHRHLRADRNSGRANTPGRRSCCRSCWPARRCASSPALCYSRVRRAGPDRRQRVHLRLCHAGRVRRLDHRLGPDPRVRSSRPRPWPSAGRATWCRSSRTSASTFRRSTRRRRTPTPRRRTRGSTSGGCSPRAGRAPGRVLNMPAVIIIALVTILLVIGIKESATLQQRHRLHQAGRRAPVHRVRRSRTSTATTGPVHPADTRGPGSIRLGRRGRAGRA